MQLLFKISKKTAALAALYRTFLTEQKPLPLNRKGHSTVKILFVSKGMVLALYLALGPLNASPEPNGR